MHSVVEPPKKTILKSGRAYFRDGIIKPLLSARMGYFLVKTLSVNGRWAAGIPGLGFQIDAVVVVVKLQDFFRGENDEEQGHPEEQGQGLLGVFLEPGFFGGFRFLWHLRLTSRPGLN